jgi:hypothetical protein
MKLSSIVVFLLYFTLAFAEKTDPEKKEFMALVKDRTEMFERYTASLSKKSGLFGNRTKNDIRDSQDKLMEIVQMDNKIMNMLNRRLGFRNFEKQSMSDDILTVQQKLINLNIVNDTLVQKLSVCEAENKKIKTGMNRHGLYFFLLILALGGALYALWRKRFRN